VAHTLVDTFFKERMPLVRLFTEIDRTGVRIDVPYLDKLSAQLGTALDRMRGELAGYADDPEFNPSSHVQVGRLLFDKMGLPILARTESGNPSTREEVLKQLEEGHDVITTLLLYRAHEKIKGTYVDGKDTVEGQKKALRAVIDADGYARTNTFISAAETFRMITRKPFPLHTWPKINPKTGIPSVRALIIPRDGYKFGVRDFSQQEWCIQACLAQQNDMVEALLDHGEDVHEMVTRDLGGQPKSNFLIDPSVHTMLPSDAFRDPEKDLIWTNRVAYQTYKNLRSMWKGVSFMILFRGGSRKLARMAFGCTSDQRNGTVCRNEGVVNCGCEQRAREYIQQYYERFEEIKWWQYRAIKEVEETGAIREVFGTYRQLPAIRDTNYQLRLEAERQACNTPVQRGGVATMIRAMLKLDKELKEKNFPGRIVFNMHDELICEFREDLAEEGMAMQKAAMEAPHPELGGRSLRSDGAILDCWGG
jgi:DNA polymerase-1